MKQHNSDICNSLPLRRPGVRRNRYKMLEMWYGRDRAMTENSAHTAQPTPIDELLDGVLERIKRPENGTLIRLRSEWGKIVGAMLERFCEAESLRDGVLVLKVRHSALLVELRPSCDLICRKVNSVLGAEVCKEVRLCT